MVIVIYIYLFASHFHLFRNPLSSLLLSSRKKSIWPKEVTKKITAKYIVFTKLSFLQRQYPNCQILMVLRFQELPKLCTQLRHQQNLVGRKSDERKKCLKKAGFCNGSLWPRFFRHHVEVFHIPLSGLPSK